MPRPWVGWCGTRNALTCQRADPGLSGWPTPEQRLTTEADITLAVGIERRGEGMLGGDGFEVWDPVQLRVRCVRFGGVVGGRGLVVSMLSMRSIVVHRPPVHPTRNPIFM